MILQLILLSALVFPAIAPNHADDIINTKAYSKPETVIEKPYDAEITGWLSGYSWEPHKYTMEYRLDTNAVQWGADAYIATGDCKYVGWKGVMIYQETGKKLTVQVFDCSGVWDGGVVNGESVLTSAGYAAELDWASWHTYPHGKVTIKLNRNP